MSTVCTERVSYHIQGLASFMQFMAVGCDRASVGLRGTRTAEITGALASSWRRGDRWLDWGSARGRTLRPKSLLDQQTMMCVRAVTVTTGLYTKTRFTSG